MRCRSRRPRHWHRVGAGRTCNEGGAIETEHPAEAVTGGDRWSVRQRVDQQLVARVDAVDVGLATASAAPDRDVGPLDVEVVVDRLDQRVRYDERAEVSRVRALERRNGQGLVDIDVELAGVGDAARDDEIPGDIDGRAHVRLGELRHAGIPNSPGPHE